MKRGRVGLPVTEEGGREGGEVGLLGQRLVLRVGVGYAHHRVEKGRNYRMSERRRKAHF